MVMTPVILVVMIMVIMAIVLQMRWAQDLTNDLSSVSVMPGDNGCNTVAMA